MELKKNPKYSMDRWRGIYFNIGLIFAILFVITAFEWKFYDNAVVVQEEKSLQVEELLVPITDQPPPEPPKVKTIAREFIEVAEEEIEIPDIEIVIDQDEIAVYEVPINTETEIIEEVSDQPFLIVEDMPMPYGGYAEFYSWVGDQLKYPRAALNLGIQGKVFIKFVIDEKGEITRVEVVKGIGAGCDEEALRVVKNSPDWKPGKQRGHAVKVQIIVPIVFKLTERGT